MVGLRFLVPSIGVRVPDPQQMFTTLIIALIVMTAAAFFLREFSATSSRPKPDAFGKMLYKQRRFLTKSELDFFRTLEAKYANEYYIVPQVPLSSIVDVDLPKKFYAYKGYRSKIDKKTLDFVLFEKVNLTPVLAFELDDYTHEREDRKVRDEFVNVVMEKVGIKLERVKSF